MTVPAQTKTTPQAIGNREDLHDSITRIYADEMPFLAAIGKSKAKSVDHEWLTADIRAGVLGNARPEGADSEATQAKLRVRLKNKCQIFGEGGTVSGTQQAVNKAGIRSELQEQVTLKAKEVMLDKEITYLSNQQYRDQVGTNAGDGRYASGIQCWATVAGNSSRGAGGVDAVINNQFAESATAGTQRAFTEQQLKDVLRGMYKNGCVGDKSALMGAELKEQASAFAGISEIRTNTGGQNKGKLNISAAADGYVSDFGFVMMQPHQSALVNECLVYKPSYVQVAALRPTRRGKLARTGDTLKFDIIGEETLKVKNPKAIGIIADLAA